MSTVDMFEGFSPPGPTPTAETRPFWDAAAENRFLVQRCLSCQSAIFYPRHICPQCWSDRLAWEEASGDAILKTWSVQHRPGHPLWATIAPYTIGLVKLSEGPTLLSTIMGSPDGFSVGMALKVRFVAVGEFTLPLFEAAS